MHGPGKLQLKEIKDQEVRDLRASMGLDDDLISEYVSLCLL